MLKRKGETKMVSAEVLKEFGLFEGLDDSELAKIAGVCTECTLNEGDLCFVQGRKATELHLCRSGKVDVLVRVYEPWGIEITIHKVKPGETFGWSALVEPNVYTASAKCGGHVETLCIKGLDLLNLFDENPHMGYMVMRNLSALVSSRLSETRERLAKELAAVANKEW